MRVVERAVVVGVGGADVGAVAVGDDEDRAPVLGHGQHGGDVVAQPVPGHGHVDALGRPDDGAPGPVVHGLQLVAPDAGGVDDDARPGRRWWPRRAPLDGADPGADDRAVGVLVEPDDRAPVGDGGAVVGGGAGHGQGQPGVVGLGVVVDEAAHHLVGVEGRHVGQGLLGADALVELADAGAAGEVVEPQGGAHGLGQLGVDHAALAEHGEEERQEAGRGGGRCWRRRWRSARAS